jgi:hypothetical protein
LTRHQVRPAWGRPLALFAAFAAVSVLTRFVVWHLDVINVDEASYMVGASELLKGAVPYTAFGDNKPPLIYAYYAIAQLVAGPGIDSVRLLTALITLPLTALGVSAFYRHGKQGAVGALLFLLYSASYIGSDMLAVNCEVVMMLPLAWSLVALSNADEARRTERGFVAGLLIAVAALVKYQAILWIPPAALAIAWANRQTHSNLPRLLSAFAIGLALPVLATITLFALVGGLEGLFYWNVTHNVDYLTNPLSPSQAVARGLSHGGPFLIVTGMLWFGAMRSASEASRYWKLLVGATIAASVAASCLGFRFFPHYFIQLYVPLSIAAAPWVASTFTRPLRAPGWIVGAVTMLLVVSWTEANRSRLRFEVAPSLNNAAVAVARRLVMDACYDRAALFVWGSAPQFYYQAKLRPASRFIFPEFPLVRFYAGNPAATSARVPVHRRTSRVLHWSNLMSDLRRSQPAFVVDLAPAGIAQWQHFPMSDYPILHQFLNRHYTRIGTIDGVAIYRRDNCLSILAERR